VDASGNVLAHRDSQQGEGIVSAEIALGAQPTAEPIPDRFWLRGRGILPVLHGINNAGWDGAGMRVTCAGDHGYKRRGKWFRIIVSRMTSHAR